MSPTTHSVGMTRDETVQGTIFDIKHFAIHDGPGIRTTVFLKGCLLRCLWCNNPEGIVRQPQLAFTPNRCIGCGYCVEVCPQGVHRFVDGRHLIDWDLIDLKECLDCGACAESCYAGALHMAGRRRLLFLTICSYDTAVAGILLS